MAGLTCECPTDDGDFAWYWWDPTDYSTLDTKKRKRCCSCHDPIDVGATVLRFDRSRRPRNEIEERIYGDSSDAITLASWYMCEPCGDIYFNLAELEYCPAPGDHMPDLLEQYVEMHKRKEM